MSNDKTNTFDDTNPIEALQYQNAGTLGALNYTTENAIKLASYLERAMTIAEGWPESKTERDEVKKLIELYKVKDEMDI
jgi:hypothetical protein